MPKDSTGLLIPGTVTPMRPVPAHIARPEYVGKVRPNEPDGTGDLYSAEELVRLRRACQIAADCLEMLEPHVVPGVTTERLDQLAHDYLVAHNAYPSTLGYRGFTKSSCTSLNEVICHGIPDDTVLESGDILNIDVTAYFEGMHGDTNRMYLVGDVAAESRQLVEVTHEATMRGIRAAKPGREVNVIGRVIEKYAGRFGYESVQDYTGHGVGRAFHSGLIIPHYDAKQFTDVIEVGMVFTVEPMLVTGSQQWRLWDDGWTVVTRDGSRCAQFEHTIYVGEDGVEILTLPSSQR
ncbi:type I methionyl aminopeptidase [Gulosibacter macacae]|uniref:Methionine aminopeptidase n=1 Tax=Gulosibacter macacae TaxID=2488791 RepID=A0A3P3W173_9MICO|nr:type I methionyl aminopeptidase [Gulosibacter macacae]RRJ88801.1 type I methionyl aminopeptidase [Gulosibacter macacae]